ncbi:MAG: fibronectin type III domain-containing protein, partial [Luteolibacter sp.]
MKKPIFLHGTMPFGSALESSRLMLPNPPAVCPTETTPDSSRWIPSTARRLQQASALLSIFILFAWSGICQAQSSIQIAWDPNPEPDIAGYYVYLGKKATDLAVHKIIRGSTTGTLTGLLPSTTYYVAVQAFNSAGLESGFSAVVSFTTRSPGAIISVEDALGFELFEGDETSAGNV